METVKIISENVITLVATFWITFLIVYLISKTITRGKNNNN